jgi:hypothetical protein
MTEKEKLQNWISEMDRTQLEKILLLTVEELIEFEEVRFSDNYSSPYWTANGESLDGSTD